MKTKKQPELLYMGCGFPVILKDVPVIVVRGKREPKIPYQEISVEVLKQLCLRPFPLTGNQVRFIRLHFDMPLRKFAELAGVTHQAVMKWEEHGDDIAKISPAIEKVIRLDALFRLRPKASEFYSLFASLDGLSKTLMHAKTSEPLKLAV